MKKKKLIETIVTEHKLSVEGVLNIDDLPDGTFIVEVEEEGEVDLKEYLERFNGELIKLMISKKKDELEEK